MKGVNNQGGGSTDSLGPGLAGMSNRVHDREGRPRGPSELASPPPSLGGHLFTCLRDVQNGYLWW